MEKKIKKIVVQKKEKVKKEKKENIFKRIRWTTGKDLFKYSVATLVFVLFFGIYFYGIDWIVLLVRSLAK